MWIRIDDGFATHPKILKAGITALGLQIRAICYASQNKTDGFIPLEAVPFLTVGLEPKDWAAHMLHHGLWDAAENGFQVHDYLEWNMSKEQYDSMKESLSRAGKKGMKSRWNGHKRGDNQGYNPPYNASYNQVNNLPITSLSTSKDSLKSLNSLNSSSSEFEQFWNSYPRKIGKKAAQKAYQQAKDKPTIVELLAAIEKAKTSEQWTKDNGQFIPHPATWLNQGRWTDEPTTTASRDHGFDRKDYRAGTW